MSWEIFLGISALLSFVIAIGKIISNNTQSMTEMKCSIDNLNNLLNSQHDDIIKLTDKIEDIAERVQMLEIEHEKS